MSDSVVVNACRQSWDESWIPKLINKDNCSGFFKSVAAHLNIPGVPNVDADGLFAYFDTHWDGVDTPPQARETAQRGLLVVAALKSTDHTPPKSNGHVVVIVDGALYHTKYPMCWCGSIGQAQSDGTKSVGEVWNRKDRDNVKYFSYWGTFTSPAPTT